MSRKKTNYKVFAECIAYSPSLTCKVGEKILLGTIKSKGNAYLFLQCMQTVYKENLFKLSIE